MYVVPTTIFSGDWPVSMRHVKLLDRGAQIDSIRAELAGVTGYTLEFPQRHGDSVLGDEDQEEGHQIVLGAALSSEALKGPTLYQDDRDEIKYRLSERRDVPHCEVYLAIPREAQCKVQRDVREVSNETFVRRD